MHKTSLLTVEAYQAYGDLIAARSNVVPTSANMGTAERYNWLADLENLRPGIAKPNLCLFKCKPMCKSSDSQFVVKILERHLLSTQVFIPMKGVSKFLVIVCLGKDRPDQDTLKAFIATGEQGISYRPGVWHHPLVAIDHVSSFSCLVWEDGSANDCEVVALDLPVKLSL